MSIQIENLDKIDWRIINELQRDGRASLVKLGKKVGLSHPSVKARLSKLIESNLVRIQANINVMKLGFNIALINVEIEDIALINDELEKLRKCLRIVFLMIKSSDYNLTLLTIYKDMRELEAFIEKRIRKIPKVKKISIETVRMVKPLFIPCFISLESDSECFKECENCDLRKCIISCPGCIIKVVSRGGK